MKLGELASRLGAELRGDPELEITGVKGIEEAGPSEITFVANPRYTALARTTHAAASLLSRSSRDRGRHDSHQESLSRLFARAGHLLPAAVLPSRHSPHRRHRPQAEIGSEAHIGAYAVVGPNVRIGAHATLLPHVVLYPGVQVGRLLFRACPCRSPRKLRSRRPRYARKWRHHRRGWIWLLKERRWPMGEDSAVRARSHRQPGGRAGQRHHRPRYRRRDGDRRRH